MARSGYFLFDRETLLPILYEQGTVAFSVAIILVSNAAVKDQHVPTPLGPIVLHRGDVLVSQRKLAGTIKAPSATVHRWIKRLTTSGFVKHQSEHAARHDVKRLVKHGLLVLTICDFDRYNRSVRTRETPSETRREIPPETSTETNRKNLVKKEPFQKQPLQKGGADDKTRSALQIISCTLDVVAPEVQADDTTIAQWLQDIHPDPWWISAALCEADLSSARHTRYITAFLRRRSDEGWTADDPQEYVEYALHPDRRLRLASMKRGAA